MKALRTISSLSCVAVLLAAASLAQADPITYANVGHIAPTVGLTAASTGDIEGYFYSESAADTDLIEMKDLTTGRTSAEYFNNQHTAAGASANFGQVNAGDQLAFVLINETMGYDLSSDPALSADGINHAYVTSFLGAADPAGDAAQIPAGTYVGMEDLSLSSSDLDYNDDDFVFTDVSTKTATPEPSSFILMGSGLVIAAIVIRRRLTA